MCQRWIGRLRPLDLLTSKSRSEQRLLAWERCYLWTHYHPRRCVVTLIGASIKVDQLRNGDRRRPELDPDCVNARGCQYTQMAIVRDESM